MAATASNGDGPASAASELDKIKPPSGMIIPPPGEIREAIEKTAGFVVRRGVGFEERIRGQYGSNPKFSFLASKEDPYNAYYEWRKTEYNSGNVTAVAAGRVGETPAAPAQEEPKGPPKPVDFKFSARMPRMNQKDLEVLRLTALYVARNGRSFMTQLAQREAGNPQFQFLIPNHTFHNFFQHMIDQYTIVLQDSKAQEQRLADLRRNVEDKFAMLTLAKQRAEYAKWQEAQRRKEEAEVEKKKEQFASIDWNDFVIVETIVFNESDDAANLPPPTTLNDLQYASLEEKNKISISSNLRIEEAFPFEETSYNAYPPPQPQATLPSHPAPATQTPPPAAPTPPPSQAPRQLSAQEAEEESRIQEREQARARMERAQAEARGGAAPMKIRENYVPRAAAKAAANRAGAQLALCPNCNQQVPMNELDEHMRIELLDPRWKEQKAKADSRKAGLDLSVVDVAGNLKRLASQRGDVFDDITGRPTSEEDEARRKRAAITTYDGAQGGKGPTPAAPANAQGVSVEEQIRAIHQKFSDKK